MVTAEHVLSPSFSVIYQKCLQQSRLTEDVLGGKSEHTPIKFGQVVGNAHRE